ncbi:Hypothetical protein AJAP_24370 [Amycolatopsis japonica]|uniref:Uncharacterized protein n=1 Tax=Amycolatopsis japonica TaxID=208439 RepID=A0A075UXJ6_9PSEU|nr:hypothetical protein [Amycolatopsis japonica]AIG77723.1 Hypothetical protein AJAP_24370 [Amycolatopsis japonica]
MERVANPYMAGSAWEVVGKLRQGLWVVFDHQWGRNGPDPLMWQEIVQATCVQEDVPVAFITIPRRDLTVVVNPRMQPSFDQVRESVDAMLRHRFTGHPIPSEMVAKTGSDNPLAADRARHRLRP